MIDTHSHLFEEEFDADRPECIERAKAAGVRKIVLVGFSHETNEKAQSLAATDSIFYPTAGLHPEVAGESFLSDFEQFKEFSLSHKIYAIGECGLDYHWDVSHKEEQKELFRLQCEYAIERDLPVIVHSRDAAKDTFDIISSFKGKLKGVMHCYSGSVEMAMEYVKLGFYISLGGPVTFKNAKEPKEVAKSVPVDRLLIETDCPFLAPVPMRGKRNETSFVQYVRNEIAALRNMSKEEVDRITEENAERLFKL